jgi:hypothetical protein
MYHHVSLCCRQLLICYVARTSTYIEMLKTLSRKETSIQTGTGRQPELWEMSQQIRKSITCSLWLRPQLNSYFATWDLSSWNQVITTSVSRPIAPPPPSKVLHFKDSYRAERRGWCTSDQWQSRCEDHFWDVALCSFVESDWRFRGAYCLHHQGDEFTSVSFYHATRRNIPDDSHPHTRRRENLKSHVGSLVHPPTPNSFIGSFIDEELSCRPIANDISWYCLLCYCFIPIK